MDDKLRKKEGLKIIAAQCLLLASKFIEIGRLYPAEIVYQIKGWSQDEFEILKSGQVEEYILKILDFDMIFLTSVEFIDFFTDGWKVSVP